MTQEEAIKAILAVQSAAGARYKIIRKMHGDCKATTLLIRDDGYRFHFMVIESPAGNARIGEWELFAEYKQCDSPGMAEIIADHFMASVAIEALES